MLEQKTYYKVLTENLQVFKEACVLSEQNLQLANLLGGCGTCSKWCDPLDYA